MNWINKLERKFGRYAITNLMFYVTILYAVGYLIFVLNPGFYFQYLSLDANVASFVSTIPQASESYPLDHSTGSSFPSIMQLTAYL